MYSFGGRSGGGSHLRLNVGVLLEYLLNIATGSLIWGEYCMPTFCVLFFGVCFTTFLLEFFGGVDWWDWFWMVYSISLLCTTTAVR